MGESISGELSPVFGQYGQLLSIGTIVVVSPKHTHRACGQAHTAWYSVPPHVSWIVDEHSPFPVVLPPPVIVHPADASGGGGIVPDPPPGVFTSQLQSPPACRRQAPTAAAAEPVPPVTTGVKHSVGVPPPLTQLIADTIDLLQEQSCAHTISDVEQPISTHAQHCWNDGEIMKSSRLGEHGPEDPEDPPLDPENPPDALDPADPLDPTPLDATPLDPTPLDATPLDPTPLDATPLDPTPEEAPFPPELTPLEAPEDDDPLPGDLPSVVSSTKRSLRPHAAPTMTMTDARSPILRHPGDIAWFFLRQYGPLGVPQHSRWPAARGSVEAGARRRPFGGRILVGSQKDTRTGIEESFMVPSPSCPYSLSPQHSTLPPSSRAHA